MLPVWRSSIVDVYKDYRHSGSDGVHVLPHQYLDTVSICYQPLKDIATVFEKVDDLLLSSGRFVGVRTLQTYSEKKREEEKQENECFRCLPTAFYVAICFCQAYSVVWQLEVMKDDYASRRNQCTMGPITSMGLQYTAKSHCNHRKCAAVPPR